MKKINFFEILHFSTLLKFTSDGNNTHNQNLPHKATLDRFDTLDFKKSRSNNQAQLPLNPDSKLNSIDKYSFGAVPDHHQRIFNTHTSGFGSSDASKQSLASSSTNYKLVKQTDLGLRLESIKDASNAISIARNEPAVASSKIFDFLQFSDFLVAGSVLNEDDFGKALQSLNTSFKLPKLDMGGTTAEYQFGETINSDLSIFHKDQSFNVKDGDL